MGVVDKLLILLVSITVVGASVKERGLSAVAGILLAGGVVGALSADADKSWTVVENDSPRHFSSVFYLSIEDSDDHFFFDGDQLDEPGLAVRHVVYIGNDDGKSLFASFLFGNYEKDRISLFGSRGLEREAISYQRIALFEDRLNKHDGVSVIAVDFLVNGNYQPARVGWYPWTHVGRELEMVAYGEADPNGPNTFSDLNLWQRQCSVTDKITTQRNVGASSCAPPSGGWLYDFGAPIFDVESGLLVGFRAGSNLDSWYVEGASARFINYVEKLQTAESKADPTDKLTTVWGVIKDFR